MTAPWLCRGEGGGAECGDTSTIPQLARSNEYSKKSLTRATPGTGARNGVQHSASARCSQASLLPCRGACSRALPSKPPKT